MAWGLRVSYLLTAAVHDKQTSVCASELRRSGSSLGAEGSLAGGNPYPAPAAARRYLCAGPPSATRLLTQLPTSVGSCSDRRQSTSSQASGGGATRRPASDARCGRPGAQGSQAEPNDYRCRQRQCSPSCRRRCATSSSATTRSSPRAAAPGPAASRSRRRPPRRSSAAPANVPSSTIQVTVHPPHSAKRHPAPLVRRKPTGRAANVALEPAPAAPDTTLALAPRHDTMTRRSGEY